VVSGERYHGMHERFEVDCNFQKSLFEEVSSVVFPRVVVMRKVVSVIFEVELDALWETWPPWTLCDVVLHKLLGVASAGLWSLRSSHS